MQYLIGVLNTLSYIVYFTKKLKCYTNMQIKI